MLKKLVSALALTSLAFGSGLCFDPYNHDYGISTGQLVDVHGLNLYIYDKKIILHNGKMQVDKDLKLNIKLVRYVVNGNKALILIKGESRLDPIYEYFVLYTECVNGKPVTKDVEAVSDFSPTAETVDLPNYPIKLGFYKDGFWTKALTINFIHHGDYSCDYKTQYYPYKLIKEGKGYEGPVKKQFLPQRACKVLAHKV
jgi:hypothetical protein